MQIVPNVKKGERSGSISRPVEGHLGLGMKGLGVRTDWQIPRSTYPRSRSCYRPRSVRHRAHP